MGYTKKIKTDESGLAAIVVTIFVMIVLSLIVIAFSQVARREQRQSLDRQLSTQAFYAAEAGINNAVNGIRTGNVSFASLDRTTCAGSSGANLDTSNNTSYTCVLYDKAPKSLIYGNVDINNGLVFSLQNENNNMTSVTFEWNGINTSGSYATCPSTAYSSFPQTANYNCPAGIIRLMLIPANTSTLSRDALVNNSMTVFLRPSSNAPSPTLGTTPYQGHVSGADSQANVIPASCDAATNKCKATITGLPLTSMYAYLRSAYVPNSVTVTGKDNAGNDVRMTNAQIKIDSTGKASDVLRRVQVRVPLYENYQLPGFSIESLNAICKQVDIVSAGASSTAACSGSAYFN